MIIGNTLSIILRLGPNNIIIELIGEKVDNMAIFNKLNWAF